MRSPVVDVGRWLRSAPMPRRRSGPAPSRARRSCRSCRTRPSSAAGAMLVEVVAVVPAVRGGRHRERRAPWRPAAASRAGTGTRRSRSSPPRHRDLRRRSSRTGPTRSATGVPGVNEKKSTAERSAAPCSRRNRLGQVGDRRDLLVDLRRSPRSVSGAAACASWRALQLGRERELLVLRRRGGRPAPRSTCAHLRQDEEEHDEERRRPRAMAPPAMSGARRFTADHPLTALGRRLPASGRARSRRCRSARTGRLSWALFTQALTQPWTCSSRVSQLGDRLGLRRRRRRRSCCRSAWSRASRPSAPWRPAATVGGDLPGQVRQVRRRPGSRATRPGARSTRRPRSRRASATSCCFAASSACRSANSWSSAIWLCELGVPLVLRGEVVLRRREPLVLDEVEDPDQRERREPAADHQGRRPADRLALSKLGGKEVDLAHDRLRSGIARPTATDSTASASADASADRSSSDFTRSNSRPRSTVDGDAAPAAARGSRPSREPPPSTTTRAIRAPGTCAA